MYMLQGTNSWEKSQEGSNTPPIKRELQFCFGQTLHQLRIWVTADKAQLDKTDPNLYGQMLENDKFDQQLMSPLQIWLS